MPSKTVYVLGAGASVEFGLPMGEQLKKTISSLFNFKASMSSGDGLSYDALGVAAHLRKIDQISCFEAAKVIHAALPLAFSIDNFIHNHRKDEFVELAGKIGIVRSILAAESNSRLYVKKHHHDLIDFSQLSDTWAVKFVQLLTEQCDIGSLRERLANISFIVFNYDRCLEHFLLNALIVSYRISREEAKEIVNEMQIYHPYGIVGKLPWMNDPYRESIGFGSDPDPVQLAKLSDDIKTFTEGMDKESSEIMAIQRSVREASRIVFLGFAYHPMNMELILGEPQEKTKTKKVFGTAYKMSDSNRDIVRDTLDAALFAPSAVLRNDVTCDQLFHEYSRSLGFC